MDIERAAGWANRGLALSARHGAALLAVGIFGGIASPGLAWAFAGFVTPNVLMMMTLVLLRLDVPAAAAHLRRPGRVGTIVAVQLLACPVLAWIVVAPLPLDPGIAAGIVIFATGAAATSSAAFARLVGLDPELSLLASLATTLLVPLTAPPIALLLLGVDLSISTGAFMLRLATVVGLPLLLSMTLRRLLGPAWLARWAEAVDGTLVWLVVFYGFGVMHGLVRPRRRPARLGRPGGPRRLRRRLRPQRRHRRRLVLDGPPRRRRGGPHERKPQHGPLPRGPARHRRSGRRPVLRPMPNPALPQPVPAQTAVSAVAGAGRTPNRCEIANVRSARFSV